MERVTVQELNLARVYSGAMLTLAERQGEADLLMGELRQLLDVVESDPAFERFIASPTIDIEARERSIETMLRGHMSDLLVNSLQVLNRKGRLSLFRALVEAYRQDHQERAGRIEVKVASAVPLSDEFRQRLHDAIVERTGKEPDLVERVDEDLIGGLVVQIADTKFDSSVVMELKKIGEALRERASHEIHNARDYVAT